MNTYPDRLTINFLRKNYIQKRMSGLAIHKMLLKDKIDIHPNIITFYGNKLQHLDNTGANDLGKRF